MHVCKFGYNFSSTVLGTPINHGFKKRSIPIISQTCLDQFLAKACSTVSKIQDKSAKNGNLVFERRASNGFFIFWKLRFNGVGDSKTKVEGMLFGGQN